MNSNAQTTDKNIKVAIVGCGAIIEAFYLPALAKYPTIKDNLIIVDNDEERVKYISRKYGIGNAVTDHKTLVGNIDGVIIATPNNTHYSLSMEFLTKKITLLSEKPLADSSEEVKGMIELAKKTASYILVNNTRRLFPSYKKVKELISEGAIGELISIEYYEGGEFNWPTSSGFYFNSKDSSKGILQDRGAHVIDLICWWLGEKPTLVQSENDSFGGCESTAHISFEHGNCSGRIKLSWLFKMENYYRIKGRDGTIEGNIYDMNKVKISSKSGKTKEIKMSHKEKDFFGFGDVIVDNFLNIIKGKQSPIVSGEDVINSIEFIEECYTNAQRFNFPWYREWEIKNA